MGPSKKKVIRLSSDDNVAVALRNLDPGAAIAEGKIAVIPLVINMFLIIGWRHKRL